MSDNPQLLREIILKPAIRRLASNDESRRIEAQALMVNDVLITQCQTQDALTQHHREGMLHDLGIALIAETLGQSLSESIEPIHLARRRRENRR